MKCESALFVMNYIIVALSLRHFNHFSKNIFDFCIYRIKLFDKEHENTSKSRIICMVYGDAHILFWRFSKHIV